MKKRDVINGRPVEEWVELKSIKKGETKTVNGRTYRRFEDSNLYEELGSGWEYVSEPILSKLHPDRFEILRKHSFECSFCGDRFEREDCVYYPVPKYKLCEICAKLYEDQIEREKLEEKRKYHEEHPTLKQPPPPPEEELY